MPYRYHYDPHQPRVQAGHSDGGQWTDGGFGADPRIQRTLLGRRPTPARAPGSTPTPLLQQAFLRLPGRVRQPRPTPAPTPPSTPSPRPDPSASPPPERTLLDAALAYFTWLSRDNSVKRQAIISFRAREYRFGKGEANEFRLEGVTVLDRTEVNDICKKLETVQKETDDASEFVRTKNQDLAPSVHGTKVHKTLADAINRLGKANFRAEVSIEKGKKADATYGTKGSIRVDVLENRGNGTVCVYDIKTGREGLPPRRMHQIAATIAETFKIVPSRIIVTQVRPMK
jgi:hypothetical protein